MLDKIVYTHHNQSITRKINETYPNSIGKSKKQRIIEYIKNLEEVSTVDSIYISEGSFNHYVAVQPNLVLGELEDCTEQYIMQVANSLGYKCYHPLIRGIGLTKRKSC